MRGLHSPFAGQADVRRRLERSSRIDGSLVPPSSTRTRHRSIIWPTGAPPHGGVARPEVWLAVARPPGASRRPNSMTETLAPIRPGKLIINGQAVDAASGKTFVTTNPATEEAICAVAQAGPEDVDRAVAAARAAFEDGPWPKMR